MEGMNGVNGEIPLLEKQGDKKPAQAAVADQALMNSTYCMLSLLLSVSSVMLSIGIAVGALNSTLDVLTGFYNETYVYRFNETMNEDDKNLLVALTVSMMLAGGFVGALSIGVILPVLSRKQSMVVMNMTNLISILLISIGGRLGPSHESIIIGRFIMGLFAGFGMNLIPIVVAETCTLSRQAFYLSLIGVNLSLGGLVGLCLGFEQVLGTADLWPVLLSMSALPSLLYIILSPWLPESPPYLLRSGNRTKAHETLRSLRLHASEEEINQSLNKIELEQKSASSRKMIYREILTRTPYRRQLVVVVMLFLQAQLCGINGVGMYTNFIFNEAGFEGESATIASTIVYLVQFVVACVGSVAVDRFGPKRINIISGSVMSGSLVLLTIALATRDLAPDMSYISVFAVTVYVLIWACGINLTLFPMIAAFTTQATRETAYFYGGGIFWIFSWFVSFIQPYFLAWMNSYAFIPWAIFNSLFVVYVEMFVPETKGKSPEEIQAFIQSGKRNFKTYKSGQLATTGV